MKLDLAARAARRSVLLSLAATCTLPSLPALAEYGEGAQIAPPALVPSPFRPTGEMAKYCEVVALGREDVCLEPKKLLTAYDSLQITKSKALLAEPRAGLPDALVQMIDVVRSYLPLVEINDFESLKGSISKFNPITLDELASTDGQRKLAEEVKADIKKLAAATKSGEASPIARVAIKLASDLSLFADSF